MSKLGLEAVDFDPAGCYLLYARDKAIEVRLTAPEDTNPARVALLNKAAQYAQHPGLRPKPQPGPLHAN